MLSGMRLYRCWLLLCVGSNTTDGDAELVVLLVVPVLVAVAVVLVATVSIGCWSCRGAYYLKPLMEMRSTTE